MKKLAFSTKVFLTAFMAIVLISCSAEDGTDGATGPQGPAGQNGIDGIDGQDGQDGNANVIVSNWLNITFGVRDTIIDNSKLKVTHFIVPELTSDILDNAAILAYMKFGSTIVPLPYTNHAGGISNTINFHPRLGKLFITRFAHDNSGSLGFGVVTFKYVFVPATANTLTGKNLEHSETLYELDGKQFNFAELERMDYKEISRLLE